MHKKRSSLIVFLLAIVLEGLAQSNLDQGIEDAVMHEVQRAGEMQAAPASSVKSLASRLLSDADATGFVHVRDIDSGDVMFHEVKSAPDNAEPTLAIDTPIPPLSVIKVYVAASWLDHGLGQTALSCSPGNATPVRHMLVDEMLVLGCDSAGADMARQLRRKVGGTLVLNDLRRYGLTEISLSADATEAEWGRVLSLGEDHVTVTPRQLSEFFAMIGRYQDSELTKSTARTLRAALERVVQKGTAMSVRRALADTGWSIGGKTGTGPGQCGDHCDGWFASLLTNRHRPRYVILVFIRGKGLGGGLAASVAASVARQLTR